MLGFLWRSAAFLWRSARGYRLRPWRSPYLRWRMETYWGIPADTIGFSAFWSFIWEHRRDLMRFLGWAGRMQQSCLQ
jgi:hypothetical protein